MPSNIQDYEPINNPLTNKYPTKKVTMECIITATINLKEDRE